MRKYYKQVNKDEQNNIFIVHLLEYDSDTMICTTITHKRLPMFGFKVVATCSQRNIADFNELDEHTFELGMDKCGAFNFLMAQHAFKAIEIASQEDDSYQAYTNQLKSV